MDRKLIIFFIITNILASSCNIQIIEFYTPGTYNITNQDYSKSENIIIELWGAGSGASAGLEVECYGKDCNDEKWFSVFYGGNSGSYIKANVITNQNSFTLVIGNGARSVPAYDWYFPNSGIGNSGGQTSFTSSNLSTNLIAGGAVAPNNNGWSVSPAKPLSLTVMGYIINNYNGLAGSIEYQKLGATSANGAAAPNGSPGGTSSNYNNITPGGGAYSSDFLTFGGNGGAIIYFSSIFTPTASLSPSQTISITKTSTSSKSIMKAPSFSSTSSTSSSVSASISPSLTPSISQSVTIIKNVEFDVIIITCSLFAICSFCAIVIWILMYIAYKIKNEKEYQQVIN